MVCVTTLPSKISTMDNINNKEISYYVQRKTPAPKHFKCAVICVMSLLNIVSKL